MYELDSIIYRMNETKQLASAIRKKKFPLKDIPKVLKKYPHADIIDSFLSRKDATACEILNVLSGMPFVEFIEKVNRHKTVITFLNKVDQKTLSFLRKNIMNEKVWHVIISHIPANMAYTEAKRFGSECIWMSYLLRSDVSDYDAVKISSKMSRNTFLAILRRKDFSVEYLDDLSRTFIGFGGIRNKIAMIVSEKQRSYA